jgi:predicted acetyltransferase
VRDDVRLEPLTPADRALAGQLWQLYQHDLSQFRGTRLDGSGRFPEGRLPLFLTEPDRCGHLIRTGPAPVGFALVRGLIDGPRVMGEFFVVRAVRRRGVGRAAARCVFAAHPGAWEIPFQEENPGAARFWRGLATELAGDAWHEERRPVPHRPDESDIWLHLPC